MATNGFQKGVSGNPGGRPKNDGRVKELARKQTETAIATLVEIMQNPSNGPQPRVAAAVALLDRGWGRPAQAITGGDEDDLPVRLEGVIKLVKP